MSESNAATALPVETPSETPNETVENEAKTTEEGVVEAKDTPVSKEAKKEEKKAEKQLKKLKLKVYGKEIDDEIDLNDEQELVKRMQKAHAADRTMQEAAEVRKAALEFIEQLRKNPRKVLTDPSIGVDVKKFAEEIINEQLADMEKTPEQREKEALMKKVQELEEQAKKKEEDVKQAELARLQAEQERIIEADITAALDIGGIPKTPRTVARMADMLMIALNNNIDLTAKDIAPYVKDNTMGEFKEIISSLSDDQLEDFLGKEVLSRLRKRNVAKAKAPTPTSQIQSTGQDNKPKEEKPAKKMTIRQFLGA